MRWAARADPSTTAPYEDLSVYSPSQTELLTNAHANGVKVLMGVGGGFGSGGSNMNYVTADPTRLQTFVTNAVTYATSKGYDGIDIDWESSVNKAQLNNLILA